LAQCVVIWTLVDDRFAANITTAIAERDEYAYPHFVKRQTIDNHFDDLKIVPLKIVEVVCRQKLYSILYCYI